MPDSDACHTLSVPGSTGREPISGGISTASPQLVLRPAADPIGRLTASRTLKHGGMHGVLIDPHRDLMRRPMRQSAA